MRLTTRDHTIYKIRNLHKDASLTERAFVKAVKEVLQEHDSAIENFQTKYIIQLQEEVGKYRQLKNLLK